MSKKPEADRDENDRSIITKQFLKKLCQYQDLFETPRLNTHLYLHYMGFIDIRNLDEYTGLRALWLESNLIRKIEGLSNLTKLRCLYLQNNGISKIENLESLKELVTLNLSHNHISIIENLSGLTFLEDLDLSHNKIAFSYSLKGLKETTILKALDLNNNLIEDSEFLLDTLIDLPHLRCLYLRGNKCVKNISNYRKNFIAKLKNLNYLDEKVVSEVERLASEAWVLNGREAEMEVRRKYIEGKEAENKRWHDEFGDYERQANEKRKEIKRKIENERDEERKKIAEERKKIFSAQNGKIDAILEELAERERKINEPIDESTLVPLLLKPGTVKYESGDFDNFGNRIEVSAANDKGVLKDLSEMPIAELEELLIFSEFEFNKVWSHISGEFNCTPETIRNFWFDYTQALEKLNELD